MSTSAATPGFQRSLKKAALISFFVIAGGVVLVCVKGGLSALDNVPPKGTYSIVIDMEGGRLNGFAYALDEYLSEWDSGPYQADFRCSLKLFSEVKEMRFDRKLSAGEKPMDFIEEIEHGVKWAAFHHGVTLHDVNIFTDDGGKQRLH